MLPSDFLLRGNSFDITVANLAQEYTNRKTAEANGETVVKPNKLTTSEMQAMIDNVKKEKL